MSTGVFGVFREAQRTYRGLARQGWSVPDVTLRAERVKLFDAADKLVDFFASSHGLLQARPGTARDVWEALIDRAHTAGTWRAGRDREPALALATEIERAVAC